MKQFVAVLILGLVVISALTEARPKGGPRGGRGRSGKHQKCQSNVPCDVNGQTLDDCKDGRTCTSDPVTLTFGGQSYNVKVCVPEGESTNNITKALVKKACQATNSTGFPVKPTRTCPRDDDCTGGPISFLLDDDTVTATFCQETDEVFDFEEFLEDLEDHHKRSSRSASEEESSESEEESSESEEESSESEEDVTATVKSSESDEEDATTTSAPLP